MGRDADPISLTGLWERAAEATPATDLETHIADIVAALEHGDLRDVILVGHSYAGVPITGVGDRVPERIRQLVYVDTWPGVDGVALADTFPPETRAFIERQLAEHGDGWHWPLPAWNDLEQVLGASLAGIGEDGLRAFRSLATPHPFGSFRQVLRLARPESEPLPKLGVLCSFSEAQLREMVAAGHPWAQCVSGPEWRFVELPTGHWPMFSEPARLAAILHDAAQARHTASSDTRTA
jgi:pimeloyl-ACP methyl ester carboxylesterase